VRCARAQRAPESAPPRRATADELAEARPSSLLGSRGALLAATRELFRLHVSLEAQRAASGALEAEAVRREGALVAAESRFDEDALRFDVFLRENDAALRLARQDAHAAAAEAAEATAQLAGCVRKPA
jgi:hypothetical protein